MQETQVQSLGQKDALEEGMATHSRTLAWEIPRTEEPGGLPSVGSQRAEYGRATSTLPRRGVRARSASSFRLEPVSSC